jgi:hypothetical protein
MKGIALPTSSEMAGDVGLVDLVLEVVGDRAELASR